MLHDNMNTFCLMIHDQHVQEARSKRKSRDAKRARTFVGGSSKNRLEIQDKPRFKKRVSNLYSNKGRDTRSPNNKSTCAKCRKGHERE